MTKHQLCNPRFLLPLFVVLGLGLLLTIIVFSPAQGPVIGYKLALVILVAVCAMIFDYLAFPYPGELGEDAVEVFRFGDFVGWIIEG